MNATEKDLETILRSEFRQLAIDPAQPEQWNIAGEYACLKAMRHAYNMGLNDGKTFAALTKAGTP